MIDASARLNADGRALAYSIIADMSARTEALDNGGDGVNTLADPAETTRNTDPGATRELHDLLRRAEGEYREMPGLSLTVLQAARLWGLDSRTCGIVLTTLLERQVLRRTALGTYLRGPRG
jgi:hypothetical protein